MDTELSSMHSLFLSKLPSMDLETVLSYIIMLFHIPLFLIRELNFLQMKYIIRPMLMEFFGLILFPIILKQLAGQKNGIALKTLLLCNILGTQTSSRMLHIILISIQNLMFFLLYPEISGPTSKGVNGSNAIHYYIQ